MDDKLKEKLEAYADEQFDHDTVAQSAFNAGAKWMYKQLFGHPSELVVGKSYWLDKMKDESGVFVGVSDNGCYMFRPDDNVTLYAADRDGLVGFSTLNNFYEKED